MFPRQCILPLPLRHPGGNSKSGRGTGQLHHGVNSDFFSFQMKPFACRKFNLLAILCDVIGTPTAHTFFSCAVCQRSCPSLLSQFVLQVAVILLDSFHAHAWLKHNIKLGTFVSCPTVYTSPRAVTSLMSGTPSPGTCTPSLTVIRPTSASSFSFDPLSGEIQPCADLRQLGRGSSAEPPTFTCVEWEIIHSTRLFYWYKSYLPCARLWIRINGRRGACFDGSLRLRGASRKCGPIESLSFCKRKLDVKFI